MSRLATMSSCYVIQNYACKRGSWFSSQGSGLKAQSSWLVARGFSRFVAHGFSRFVAHGFSCLIGSWLVPSQGTWLLSQGSWIVLIFAILQKPRGRNCSRWFVASSNEVILKKGILCYVYVCMYVSIYEEISFGSWNLLSSLPETMTLVSGELLSELLSLLIVERGPSRNELDRLLKRPGFPNRRWMKDANIRDEIEIEERWSYRWPLKMWWRAEGLCMM